MSHSESRVLSLLGYGCGADRRRVRCVHRVCLWRVHSPLNGIQLTLRILYIFLHKEKMKQLNKNAYNALVTLTVVGQANFKSVYPGRPFHHMTVLNTPVLKLQSHNIKLQKASPYLKIILLRDTLLINAKIPLKGNVSPYEYIGLPDDISYIRRENVPETK